MGTPSAIRVNDDLTSSKTRISMGATNHKPSRGVEVVDGLVIEVLSRDNRLDHVLHKIRGDLLVGDILRVLGGDHNSVNALGHWNTILELVLTSDLSLAIGAHPVASAVLANLSELGSQRCGKHVSEGHESVGLISGVPKHDALVTSTDVFNLNGIHRLRNVGGLFLDGHNDIASLVVKTLGRIVIADVADSITDDLLVVDSRLRRDLAEDHDHASLAASLTRYTGGLIPRDARIEDSIRHLIAKLVRMALVDGLRSEKEGSHG
mmetsp:Transcript_32632/g.60018  ORF Transcript_32632/g.60018 Transcript_32632/m.60018 type:complete len:264 (+) Transcript_32632:660-1451(+)